MTKRKAILSIFILTFNILFAQHTKEDIGFETDTLEIQEDSIYTEEADDFIDLIDLSIVNDRGVLFFATAT